MGTITIEQLRERTRVFMSVRVIHVSQSEQPGYPWWTGGQVTFWHTRVDEFERREESEAECGHLKTQKMKEGAQWRQVKLRDAPRLAARR
jgi:hypothetical protein